MRARTRHASARRAALLPLALLCVVGTVRAQSDLNERIADYRDRMLIENQRRADARRVAMARQPVRPEMPRVAVSKQPGMGPVQSLVTEPRSQQPADAPGVLRQIPDPTAAAQTFAYRMDDLRRTSAEGDRVRLVSNYQRVVDQANKYLDTLELREQRRLSLAECIQRALEYNYSVRISAYDPAISRTQVVAAEAAFDAVFFLDTSWVNNDRPSSTELSGNQSDIRTWGGGFRQLLPTGMQVQTSLNQTRTYTDLQFATLNPAYDTTFGVSFTQPLMRNFGLDFNRSLIEIAKLDLRTSEEDFLQQVRDTLLQVEQAYWLLASTRRRVMILSESVAQQYVTYLNLQQRLALDATEVEVQTALARWRQNETNMIEAIKTVRESEDVLKNLLNDPSLLISEELELIPTDEPFLQPLAIDQFAAIRTAIEERSEVRVAEIAIEQARLQTLRAKNQVMPRLDLTFNYEVDGLDVSADASFDNMTSNRYRTYSVGLSFEWPIGNRRARADLRGAKYQENQSVIALQQVMDGVVTETNQAVRDLRVGYEKIPPQLESVVAADRALRAAQARTEAITPSFLETELNFVERVATTRLSLLDFVIEYNTALVDLERSKGTLLEYNNVVVADEPRK